RDHAERALAADDEVDQARPRGGGGGTAPEDELAAGRGHAHAEHVVVDPPVARGGLPRGSRRDVAADRRLLVALRVVPESDAVAVERALGLRATQAGTEGRS